MPTWPASPVVTTNMDAGSDSPATARSDIKTMADDVNLVIAARGVADGIAALDSAGLVPQAEIPITPISGGAPVVFSTPGSTTWTVPAGVYRVKVTVVGAGGGGGFTSSGDHGGGGGAGAVAEKHFTVVPGTVFSFTVGAHGVGKSSGSDGAGTAGAQSNCSSDGTATPASFTVTAGAGGAGQGTSGNNFGGGGGQAVNGDINKWGGAGISGATRGGAGGSNAFTGGAAGATGYGGGGGFGSGNVTSGFDGLDGAVIFEF